MNNERTTISDIVEALKRYGRLEPGTVAPECCADLIEELLRRQGTLPPGTYRIKRAVRIPPP